MKAMSRIRYDAAWLHLVGGDDRRGDPRPLREAAARARCGTSFAAAARFEASHRLALRDMPAAYLSQRSALASGMLSRGADLGLEDEVAHDAVLLLDRTASAGEQALLGVATWVVLLGQLRRETVLVRVETVADRDLGCDDLGPLDPLASRVMTAPFERFAI